MSELRVDNIVDMGGSGAPQLRKGANVTGISTITQAVVGNATINAGGINATGIVTSSSNKFVGDLASGNITAGVMTATSSVVASNITINSGGVNASGIVSATSYQGSGANLTGVGLTIAPLMYNPDVGTSAAALTGIGLTFNQRVFAGTGNVTLSLTSVGSTLVENFSVGSSVTYNNDADPPNITITPTSSLTVGQRYAISYPSGAFTQTGAGGSFVGTAYTFTARNYSYNLWAIGGYNTYGNLGLNSSLPGSTGMSSPVQITGNWSGMGKWNLSSASYTATMAFRNDGTLWAWGSGAYGALAQNNRTQYSSPVQIPGTTWAKSHVGKLHAFGTKTDGTFWSWGRNNGGMLGLNTNVTLYSSPVQLGSDTTWPTGNTETISSAGNNGFAIKTDGTLWAWGDNVSGHLGANLPNNTQYSSPIQIPGTNWKSVAGGNNSVSAVKTDGTLWTWGKNLQGSLGQNESATVYYSSPVQVPGTDWAASKISGWNAMATKTDGTLWSWGYNGGRGTTGIPGIAHNAKISSPTQVGSGTNWDSVVTQAGRSTFAVEQV